MNDAERINWNNWKDNTILVTHGAVQEWLETNKPSRKLLREYFYRIGIQPDEWLIQRVTQDRRQILSRASEYEIRFNSKSNIAMLKLSGLI